jgi:hypothetical protein
MQASFKKLSLASLFALTLAACGGGGDDTTAAAPTPGPSPTPIPGQPNGSPVPGTGPFGSTPGATPAPPPATTEAGREMARYTGTWRFCQIERFTVDVGGDGVTAIGSQSKTEVYGPADANGNATYQLTTEFYTSQDCSGTSVGGVQDPAGSVTYSGKKITATGDTVDRLFYNLPGGNRILSGNARVGSTAAPSSVVINLGPVVFPFSPTVPAVILRDISLNSGGLITYGPNSATLGADGYPTQLNAFRTWRKIS